MNSDTYETAEEIAKRAGAIVKCPICHENELRADDDEADRRAYAVATQQWKGGGRGFRGMSREEALGAVKSVLDDALLRCPRCSFMSDPM